MSRLQLASPRGLIARLAFFFSRRMLGKVPTSLKVLAHHRTLLAGTVHMERAQGKADALPERVRLLASLRVATLVGCPF